EIGMIKQDVVISAQVLQDRWDQIKIGTTELGVNVVFEYQLTILCADAIAFATIVLSGKRAALPHGSAGDTKINRGDLLLFDFGVTKDGYHSDLTRTCIVGEGTEEQIKIYNTVREAKDRQS